MICTACRLARQRAVGGGVRAAGGARGSGVRRASQWAAAAARPAVSSVSSRTSSWRTITATPPTMPLTTRRAFSSAPPTPDTPSETTTAPASPPKPDFLDDAESVIWDRLTAAFAPVTALSVRDISGGCGSMYGIEICAEAFRGRGMLQQQRMVNGVLGDLMKSWHGVQLKTRVPE